MPIGLLTKEQIDDVFEQAQTQGDYVDGLFRHAAEDQALAGIPERRGSGVPAARGGGLTTNSSPFPPSQRMIPGSLPGGGLCVEVRAAQTTDPFEAKRRTAMFDRNINQWFEEAKRDGNPYLTEWFALAVMTERRRELWAIDQAAWDQDFSKAAHDGTLEITARAALVRKYAWAIPCEAALTALSQRAPLVEIGAGLGYWAWLLRKQGVDIIAYDHAAPTATGDANRDGNELWTAVLHGTPAVLEQHADRALFLCWPDYDSPMAADCLKQYRGQTVVFVGESEGGCTGNYAFFQLLERDWEHEQAVELPQFEGLHDYLSVYVRK